MILTINATYDLNRQMQVTEKNEAKKIEQGIEDTIAQQFDLLRIGLEPIIHNEQIIDAFQQRDRAALAQQTNVLMPQLQAQGVKQFQFHLPNATSFYRVHKPEEFGDDLSTFRHTVVEANKTKQIVEGLEGGVAGAGFRYVVPLSQGTTHLGTVELGLGVTEELLQKFWKDARQEFAKPGKQVISDEKIDEQIERLRKQRNAIIDAYLTKTESKNGVITYHFPKEVRTDVVPQEVV